MFKNTLKMGPEYDPDLSRSVIVSSFGQALPVKTFHDDPFITYGVAMNIER